MFITLITFIQVDVSTIFFFFVYLLFNLYHSTLKSQTKITIHNKNENLI
jgi:hypothetical protein